MMMKFSKIAGVAFVCLLAASCTKPAPEAGAAVAPVGAEPAAATAATFIYNAFTARSVTSDGTADEPAKAFASNQKVYVGVVLRGEADVAEVKVDWSTSEGQALGSGQTTIAVTGASVATIDISKTAMFAPGAYKAIVSLDGKPGWELAFEVTQ